MYLPELVCASAGTPIDVDGAFGLPTSAHLSYESFDQCAPTGSVSTTPATTKLPPLNLYWSRRCEEAASASQLMDTSDDDDVFGAVYTDLAEPGGCGGFRRLVEGGGGPGLGRRLRAPLAVATAGFGQGMAMVLLATANPAPRGAPRMVAGRWAVVLSGSGSETGDWGTSCCCLEFFFIFEFY